MVAGSARPLTDALRIAFVELIDWLVADYGFDKAEAYQVVSQVAVVRVANVVDPLYTVVAKFPKRYLPPRTARRRARAAAGQRSDVVTVIRFSVMRRKYGSNSLRMRSRRVRSACDGVVPRAIT